MTHDQDQRREFLWKAALGAGALATIGCQKRCPEPASAGAASAPAGRATAEEEEYVWVSANATLPLFVEHDQKALAQAGRDLGVKTTVAGPSTNDIPALVAAIEQIAARRPAGMLVIGWAPTVLLGPINAAVEAGVPVVTVDGDVPGSKRCAFVGTDWVDLGAQVAKAMIKSLRGKRGKVARLGIVEQEVNEKAFRGFQMEAEKAGLVCLEPVMDRGNVAEAARVATGVLQAHPDLVGIAGFDSESGPGIGQAIKEAGKTGTVVATCVDAEPQHLALVKEGVLAALVGQKRELFTYWGAKVLYDMRHSPLRLTPNDAKTGVLRVPDTLYTGTYLVTTENVDSFLGG